MDSSDLLLDKQDGIAILTMNRPAVLNAMLPQNFVEIDTIMREIENDPAIGVAIVTGAGDRAFCSGADLGEGITKVTGSAGLDVVIPDPRQRFFSRITKPIIAAVNGVCVAGGTEILLGTDIRVAAQHARFGIAEARWGLIACGGGTSRIARQIPWAKAMEMVLMGTLLDADEAYRIGLINRVVPGEEVMSTSLQIAERMMQNGPLAMRKAKEVIVNTHAMDWNEAFEYEHRIGKEVMTSEDAKEGPLAFLAKRLPKFKGR